MHQTKRPPRPDWREKNKQPDYHRFGKRDYYCLTGEHWFSFEQADYCDNCGQFICSQHEHDCLSAQKAKNG